MRTGGDTQAVEITPLMVDNGLAINDMQCLVRTNLDTLAGTAALLFIDQYLHYYTLNPKRFTSEEVI